MKNNYLIFLFPSSKNMWDEISEKLENANVKIIACKTINVTDIGKFNLINNLYKNEEWLGNKDDNFDGLYYKLKACFNNDYNQCLIYYVLSSENQIKVLKKDIRQLCNIGNHSIHTTDTIEETNRLFKIYFNDNTIKFYNCIKKVEQNNFNYLFEEMVYYLNKKDIDNEDICLSGSSPMSIYNLRDCYDIDFFCKTNKIKFITKKIESYNDYYLNSKFYKKTKLSIQEIFNNDENYFYYNGIKTLSLEALKSFKLCRNEDKDIIDVRLIDEVLNNENYKC